jgi:hypothetical protein
MTDDITTAPAIQLVPAALTPGHPRSATSSTELQRRWNLAEQSQRQWNAVLERHTDGSGFLGDPAAITQAALDAGYDPAAIDDARNILGVLTLIYEQWVLQEADVEPDALYAAPGNQERVSAILEREYLRQAASTQGGLDEFGQRYEPQAGEADPLGRGAARLSFAVGSALFAAPAELHDELDRWVGDTPANLLWQKTQLCRHALASLRDPWSLDRRLATPGLGKNYHQPHHIPTHGLDVALGRPGTGPADKALAAEIATARRAIEIKLDNERGRLIQHVSPARYHSVTRSTRLRHALGAHTEFIETALAVASIATDRVLRVEGRPVASELRDVILQRHRDAAAFADMGVVPRTAVTIGGVGVTWNYDHHAKDVLAEVNAAGATIRLDPEDLDELLALLGNPRALITEIGSIRLNYAQRAEMERARPTRERPTPIARPQPAIRQGHTPASSPHHRAR